MRAIMKKRKKEEGKVSNILSEEYGPWVVYFSSSEILFNLEFIFQKLLKC